MHSTLSDLRVAIIHYWLTTMRGGEKVLEALCDIFPQADIFTHVVSPGELSPALRSHAIHTTFIQKLPGSVRHYQRYLPLMPLALEQLDLRAYDLVLSSESGPAKGVITRAETPHICYCHSPMRYLWDAYPEYLASADLVTRLGMRLLFPRLRQWDYISAQRVDAIIANSSAVQRRIRRWWGRDSVVIHPPVDVERFARPDMTLLPHGMTARSYYLCLGELVCYKRIDLAVEACNAGGLPLVIAGDGPEKARLQRLAGPTIRFLGRVDDALVPPLLAGCKAFLLPGQEDFGITPVEAMAAGRPVVAFRAGGALDTVIDGKTGRFFTEQSPRALLDALKAFESEGDHWSAETLRAHAATFSHRAFRRAMLDVILKTLDGVAPPPDGLTAPR